MNIISLADIPDPTETPEFLNFKKTLRVGDVSFDTKGYVDLYENGNIIYSLGLHRIKRPEDLAEWSRHLHAKTWMTPQMFYDFFVVLDYIDLLERAR
jgi:hypothetical protein